MTEPRHPVQVVVAYDFTPTADEALMRAADVAARAPQHVLHIVAALDPRGNFGVGSNSSIRYQGAEYVQQEIRDRAVAAFAGRTTASEVQFYVHARIGPPAVEILALAEDVGADLIFIGSHGKTGLERVLLGSVSEVVVRRAKCPVVVVRPKTYKDVDLLRVVPDEHDHHAFHPPHRYSYVEKRVLMRPLDWPIS